MKVRKTDKKNMIEDMMKKRTWKKSSGKILK